MEEQFLKPDKDYKKKVIIILIISIIAGLAALAYFHIYFQEIKELAEYDHEQALAKMLFLFRIIMVSMAFTLASFGIYMSRVSIKTIISEQFPPPGIKVVKKTGLIFGRPAKIRGYIGIILAILIIITGITFPAFFYLKINHDFYKSGQNSNIKKNITDNQGYESK